MPQLLGPDTRSCHLRLPVPERRILRPAEGEALVGHVERALGDRGRGREVRVDDRQQQPRGAVAIERHIQRGRVSDRRHHQIVRICAREGEADPIARPDDTRDGVQLEADGHPLAGPDRQ